MLKLLNRKKIISPIFNFLLLVIGFSLVAQNATAQTKPIISNNNSDNTEGFEFSYRTNFNGTDFFMGFDFGWTDFNYKYSII